MSRAFLRDDPPDLRPQLNHRLPDRQDPGFDAAAARALLETLGDGGPPPPLGLPAPRRVLGESEEGQERSA